MANNCNSKIITERTEHCCETPKIGIMKSKSVRSDRNEKDKKPHKEVNQKFPIWIKENIVLPQPQPLAPAYSFTSMKSKQLMHMRSMSAKQNVLTIGNQFKVGLKIATGSFGEVRLGKCIQSGEDVIIKLEPMNTKVPTLLLEYRFYSMLGMQTGECLCFFDRCMRS